MPLDPVLLPGETMVAAADGVLLYLPMSEQRQGVSGRLHVTNFKLSFVTLSSVTAALVREGEFGVGLLGIQSGVTEELPCKIETTDVCQSWHTWFRIAKNRDIPGFYFARHRDG